MKLLRSVFAVLLAFVAYGTTCAQGLLVDQTYVNVPTFRTETTDFSTQFKDGSTFVGQRTASYANAQITHVAYGGTLTYPDGTKLISVKYSGNFDQRFAAEGHFAIQKDGQTIFAEFRQGQMQRTYTPQKEYFFKNHCVEFYYEPDTSVKVNGAPIYGGSSSGYSSGSDNSSSGSGYVSRRATCAGCNGTGICSLCNGRGYNDRGYQCSRCHGTGKCTTCHGTGKLTVF